MKPVFFKNRKGQTPLEESMRKDLKLQHIQDMTELYEHEIENIVAGIAWSQSVQKDHLDHYVWIELHKQMYKDVWKWAGKVREGELANTDFHMPFNIRPALLDLEKDLKFWLKNQTFPSKEMAAVFHEKLLTIHPFRDGNGRWSRVLTEFVCSRENMEVPNWGKDIASDEERRDQYIAAIKEARHDLNYSKLIEIMFN